MSGKSDAIDAEHAARQLLAGIDMPVPKAAGGQVEAIRLIKIARDSAVKARSATMITLKATLVTAGTDLRAALEPLSDYKLIEAAAALPADAAPADPGTAMHHTLGSLARRWLLLHEEVKDHGRQLKKLTKLVAPQLVEAVGIGYDTRRTAEGLSKREIIRCLKRYLAREIYHLLPSTTATSASTPKEPELPTRSNCAS